MSCIGSSKIISRWDIEYEKYELYYLMNFTQLPPEQQLEYFYIKNIDPVHAEKHYDAVCLDVDYNCEIINPLYQLFVCIYIFNYQINFLLREIYDYEKIDEFDDLRMKLFEDGSCEKFLSNLHKNTSIDGFYGKQWTELRRRCRVFLKKIDLLDSIQFVKPIKFAGFLYPDDFLVYEKSPHWSRYGEFMDRKKWDELKAWNSALYKDAVLNDWHQ
jgi:hypothetical protein